jgi:hypothetical protein
MVGNDGVSYVREVSEVDPKSKTVVLKSVNLTFANYLQVHETCTYTPSPTSAHQTLFQSTSKVNTFGVLKGASSKVEDWSVNLIAQNAERGKKGLESILALAETAFRRQEN